MNKTLLALATVGAMVGTAQAADVQLYGVVDGGLGYTHVKSTDSTGKTTTTDSLEAISGYNASNRFGLKGSEDLGNGYSVNFKLENGYNLDDGTLGNDGRLFGREAQANIATPYGTLAFGRMGGVGSSAGTFDVVFATADAFDGGDNDVFGLYTSSRYDNMVTYQSPVVAGLQATLQYSFNTDGKTVTTGEGSSDVDRYVGAALTAQCGAHPAQAVIAYESTLYKNTDMTNSNAYYVGGNYDFGVTKLFVMGQYLDHVKSFGFAEIANDKADGSEDRLSGWGAHIGAITPVAGGDWTVGVYYTDGKKEAATATTAAQDFSYLGVSTRYAYPLSKRTSLYVGAGYGDLNYKDTKNNDTSVIQVYSGLQTSF